MDIAEYYHYINTQMTPINRGYKCLICGRKIVHSNYENNQGDGFMRISMMGHIKKHMREKGISPDYTSRQLIKRERMIVMENFKKDKFGRPYFTIKRIRYYVFPKPLKLHHK